MSTTSTTEKAKCSICFDPITRIARPITTENISISLFQDPNNPLNINLKNRIVSPIRDENISCCGGPMCINCINEILKRSLLRNKDKDFASCPLCREAFNDVIMDNTYVSRISHISEEYNAVITVKTLETMTFEEKMKVFNHPQKISKITQVIAQNKGFTQDIVHFITFEFLKKHDIVHIPDGILPAFIQDAIGPDGYIENKESLPLLTHEQKGDLLADTIEKFPLGIELKHIVNIVATLIKEKKVKLKTQVKLLEKIGILLSQKYQALYNQKAQNLGTFQMHLYQHGINLLEPNSLPDLKKLSPYANMYFVQAKNVQQELLTISKKNASLEKFKSFLKEVIKISGKEVRAKMFETYQFDC